MKGGGVGENVQGGGADVLTQGVDARPGRCWEREEEAGDVEEEAVEEDGAEEKEADGDKADTEDGVSGQCGRVWS